MASPNSTMDVDGSPNHRSYVIVSQTFKTCTNGEEGHVIIRAIPTVRGAHIALFQERGSDGTEEGMKKSAEKVEARTGIVNGTDPATDTETEIVIETESGNGVAKGRENGDTGATSLVPEVTVGTVIVTVILKVTKKKTETEGANESMILMTLANFESRRAVRRGRGQKMATTTLFPLLLPVRLRLRRPRETVQGQFEVPVRWTTKTATDTRGQWTQETNLMIHLDILVETTLSLPMIARTTTWIADD